jgi:outer membrane immunogenic protein
MKRFVLGAVALLATGATAPVGAADYPPPPPARPPVAYPPQPVAYPPPVAYPLTADCYRWFGPYIGGNLGFAWGTVENNFAKPSGLAGGLQGGFNWQNGPYVFGIEGDIQVTGAEDTFAPWKFSNPWFGTIRGRAGYSFANVLFYGTAGLAFGELHGETFGLAEPHTSAGWTVGFGTEFALAPMGFGSNWTAKIEYLYVDLASNPFTITGVSNGLRFGEIRAGVNYHF